MLSFSYQTLKDATPFPSPLSKTQPPQMDSIGIKEKNI